MDTDDHAELTGLLVRLERRLADTGEAGVIGHYPIAPPR
jgi:hypothetical protein